MAKFPIPAKPDRVRVGIGDWENAYSDFVCEVCGCKYKEHIPVAGYRWLRRLCDGKLVKLIG